MAARNVERLGEPQVQLRHILRPIGAQVVHPELLAPGVGQIHRDDPRVVPAALDEEGGPDTDLVRELVVGRQVVHPAARALPVRHARVRVLEEAVADGIGLRRVAVALVAGPLKRVVLRPVVAHVEEEPLREPLVEGDLEGVEVLCAVVHRGRHRVDDAVDLADEAGGDIVDREVLRPLYAGDVLDGDRDGRRHGELAQPVLVNAVEVGLVAIHLPDVRDPDGRLTPELPLDRRVELVGVRRLHARVEGRADATGRADQVAEVRRDVRRVAVAGHAGVLERLRIGAARVDRREAVGEVEVVPAVERLDGRLAVARRVDADAQSRCDGVAGEERLRRRRVGREPVGQDRIALARPVVRRLPVVAEAGGDRHLVVGRPPILRVERHAVVFVDRRQPGAAERVRRPEVGQPDLRGLAVPVEPEDRAGGAAVAELRLVVQPLEPDLDAVAPRVLRRQVVGRCRRRPAAWRDAD